MRPAFVVAALILGIAMLSATVDRASAQVNIYVGYLNNLSGPPNSGDIPTPFDSNATTTLISSGGSTTAHDTGVIRFENTGAASVTIDPGLVVNTQGGSFQVWDSFLPFVLGPGQNLVLAETANFNFDSSDFGLGSNPVVSASINGNAFRCVDINRILLGHEEAGNTAETTPYGLICTQGTVVPEPGTLTLFATAGIGLLLGIRRKRMAR